MTCEHSNCSLNVFSTCTNHCIKNLCLEHLIEHGDRFLNDCTNLLNNLEKSTTILTKEVNNGAMQIIQRREYEIERINRMYDDEQEQIRKQLTFAETANILFRNKQIELEKCKQKNEYSIAQYDFEQIKSYTTEIKKILLEKQKTKDQATSSKSLTKTEISNNSAKVYPCPLIRPNVFGIKPQHNIRFDCDGSTFPKYNLARHFENYHRILPKCAARLQQAVIDGQSPDQTKLFSDNDVIYNEEFFIDCPLKDSTNVFGAEKYISILSHIPCHKTLTSSALTNHLQYYHRMKYDAAKQINQAIKNKTLHSNLILFEHDQRIGTTFKKK